MEKLNLAGRMVGPGEPPYILAEIGANHNGDMDLCRRLIDSAKSCGADAVKFQSWSPSSLVSKHEYERNTSYSDRKKHFGSLAEMVEKYQLTRGQHREIAEYCRKQGITFLSSCFSPEEVDLLDELNVPAFKIASMDINNLALLRYVAARKRGVVLSTGMSTLGEIEQAIQTLHDAGSGPIALLHCISIYPPATETIHLRNITTLQTAFDVPVGFSDHSIGTAIPLAAIALGACIIEKHFTLDKDLPGWDHAISADPSELATIAIEGHNIFLALGSTVRTVTLAEAEKRTKFRRRAILARPMKSGEIVHSGDLKFLRPGTGINPDEVSYIVGRTVKSDLEADHELEWSDLA
jgi:N,N'-diacetyllegionaminate synthase